MRRAITVAVVLSCLVAVPAPAEAATGGAKSVAAAQRRANAAAARLAAAQTALARAERQAADVGRRAEASSQRMQALESQVRDLAIRQYVNGAPPTALLDSADLSEIARRQAMIRFVTLGSADAIDSYRAARQDFVASRTSLERSNREHRNTIARLRAESAAAVRELERLAAAQRALEARQRRTRGSAAARVSGGTRIFGSGSWVCPVQGPRAFSNDWGAPRSGGRRHQGNDILAPRGTPVVAPVAGHVRHHNSGLGGLSFYLKGVDGNTYFGTHLAAYASAGNVAAGTMVGTVGNTGNARGGPPHLHFEIHPGGGRPVNPYPTLSVHCR